MKTTKVRLGKYCLLRNGFAFKSTDFSQNGVPLIRISDISDGNVSDSKSVRVPFNDIYDKFIVNEGDILIAMSGATTGKLGRYVSTNIAYQNQRVGCFVILDDTKLDKEYLYYLVLNLKPRIERDAYGGGQPNISSKIIEDYPVNLPLLDDQKRIAKVLGKAEELIQKRKQTIALLDEYVKSVFLDMFGDPVRNEKGWNTDTLSNLTTKIGSGATPKGGKSSYIKSGISLIRSMNIHDLTFVYKDLAYISVKQADQLKIVTVETNDVLLNITGASVCRSTIVPENVLPARVNQHVSILRPNNRLSSWYLVYSLVSKNFKQRLLRIANDVGATREALTKEQLENISIPVPPKALQDKFAVIAEKAKVIKQHYELSLDKLERLYASLSQLAFKGDLDVSRVPLDDSRYGDPFEGHEYEGLLNLDKAKEILEEKRKAGQEKLEEGRKKVAPPQSGKRDNKTDNKAADDEYLNFTGDEEAGGNTIETSIGNFEDPLNAEEAPKGSLETRIETSRDKVREFSELRILYPPSPNPKVLREMQVVPINDWEIYDELELARIIRQKFDGSDFTADMLIDFLVIKLNLGIKYFTSEELKVENKTRGRRDFKDWLFSCIQGENKYLKLKQFYHDDYRTDRQLIIPEDYIKAYNQKDSAERSGIYFNIIS